MLVLQQSKSGRGEQLSWLDSQAEKCYWDMQILTNAYSCSFPDLLTETIWGITALIKNLKAAELGRHTASPCNSPMCQFKEQQKLQVYRAYHKLNPLVASTVPAIPDVVHN